MLWFIWLVFLYCSAYNLFDAVELSLNEEDVTHKATQKVDVSAH